MKTKVLMATSLIWWLFFWGCAEIMHVQSSSTSFEETYDGPDHHDQSQQTIKSRMMR